MDSLRRRDPAGAVAFLSEAERAAPADLNIKMQKAAALRATGDLTGALGVLEIVLAADPYHFVALLSKGSLVENLLGVRQAAVIYRNVLKIAPPDDRLPPGLRAPMARARTVVEDNGDALAEFLRREVAEVRARHEAADLERFDEALEVYAGRRPVYVQQPVLMHYPRLPAVPFYDRALFPWLPELEAATDMIREELMAALGTTAGGFSPYIAYRPGEPVNQWADLNHSERWRSLWLWKDGVRQAEACKACPRTAALLDRLPMASQPGFAPTALFSALEGGVHIPPHTGSTNARLLVHLPLMLPGPSRFRVGCETRSWAMGQAWVFDDTLEHEAWNDADALRVILIFDVWNPYLSDAERELITAMMNARKAYYDDGSGPT